MGIDLPMSKTGWLDSHPWSSRGMVQSSPRGANPGSPAAPDRLSVNGCLPYTVAAVPQRNGSPLRQVRVQPYRGRRRGQLVLERHLARAADEARLLALARPPV